MRWNANNFYYLSRSLMLRANTILSAQPNKQQYITGLSKKTFRSKGGAKCLCYCFDVWTKKEKRKETFFFSPHWPTLTGGKSFCNLFRAET